MEDFIDDIEFAVQHHRWLIALAGSLALPDMCAAIQSENGQTTGSKYKRWVQTYLAEKYPRLDPDEMYKMRCSLLHQGTSSTIKYNRVAFAGPESHVVIHNSVVEDAEGISVLILDLPTFCRDVIEAVGTWREAVEQTAHYQRNVEKVMRWRADGLDPYFMGGRVLS